MSNYNNDLVLEQLAEIESLRQQLAEKETQRQNLMGAYQRQGDSAQAVITDLRQQLAAKQADVDALMLEYCPNEMSQEQLYNWAAHQKSWSPEDTLREQAFLILSRLQSGTEDVVRLDAALAAVVAERERCVAALMALESPCGVNEDGQAWMRALTRGDCVKALMALRPNAQVTGASPALIAKRPR